MVNFPPTIPVSNTTPTTWKGPSHRIVPSSATDKRETRMLERRRMRDRRSRRGAKQVMDRRYGLERRRSSIDLSI